MTSSVFDSCHKSWHCLVTWYIVYVFQPSFPSSSGHSINQSCITYRAVAVIAFQWYWLSCDSAYLNLLKWVIEPFSFVWYHSGICVATSVLFCRNLGLLGFTIIDINLGSLHVFSEWVGLFQWSYYANLLGGQLLTLCLYNSCMDMMCY